MVGRTFFEAAVTDKGRDQAERKARCARRRSPRAEGIGGKVARQEQRRRQQVQKCRTAQHRRAARLQPDDVAAPGARLSRFWCSIPSGKTAKETII